MNDQKGRQENDLPVKEARTRRPLFERTHSKRSVWPWLIPLLLIIAVMVLLPRFMDQFFPG